MRTYFTALVLLLLECGLTASTAQTLAVEERLAKTEESIEINSWTARLDQDADFCMNTYGDFIKETFKTKVDKRGKTILVAEQALIPELSNLRLDQRAIFSAESGGTSVSFTFSPGYDIHFGHELYKTEFTKAQEFVKNFVRYHYKSYYNDLIKSLQGKIESAQNDIESNGRKTDKNNKTITDNKSDGETAKIKSKNDKMVRENEAYALDTTKKRKEIVDLEDQLSKANEGLRKALDFK